MKGGIGGMMKQAQKIQENMQKAQEELAEMEVTGKAGGGMVSVIMNGRHDVKRVSIDD
ncbi:MAG: YbaB/EbfC family nucleoid-associated protein, partial [Gammaproteobacteria bacterium]|nr:YbaB/EbfC family nucleoid-associated protein [Gammaproteobacteria bacterium]